MKKYVIKIYGMGEPHEMKINEECFKQLKAAKAVLSAALHMEEIYEMIVSGFLDLERESANMSILDSVRGIRGYEEFYDTQLAQSVRLVNFLTAVRMYRDQMGTYMSCIMNDPSSCKKFKSLFHHKESKPEFRFMEVLRNYTQHCGIPVHLTSFSWESIDESEKINESEKMTEYSSDFYALKELLEESNLDRENPLTPKVLGEMPEKVNLLRYVRIYVESVSEIHEEVRKQTKESVQAARAKLSKAISDYKAQYGERALNLHALEFQDGKLEPADKILITIGDDDTRERLASRNSKIVGVSNSYVSTKAKE